MIRSFFILNNLMLSTKNGVRKCSIQEVRLDIPSFVGCPRIWPHSRSQSNHCWQITIRWLFELLLAFWANQIKVNQCFCHQIMHKSQRSTLKHSNSRFTFLYTVPKSRQSSQIVRLTQNFGYFRFSQLKLEQMNELHIWALYAS